MDLAFTDIADAAIGEMEQLKTIIAAGMARIETLEHELAQILGDEDDARDAAGYEQVAWGRVSILYTRREMAHAKRREIHERRVELTHLWEGRHARLAALQARFDARVEHLLRPPPRLPAPDAGLIVDEATDRTISERMAADLAARRAEIDRQIDADERVPQQESSSSQPARPARALLRPFLRRVG